MQRQKKIDWKAKLLSQEQPLQSITKGETIFYKKKEINITV